MDYGKRAAKASLETYLTLRRINLGLLKSLTREQWQRVGNHAERGPETLGDCAHGRGPRPQPSAANRTIAEGVTRASRGTGGVRTGKRLRAPCVGRGARRHR